MRSVFGLISVFMSNLDTVKMRALTLTAQCTDLGIYRCSENIGDGTASAIQIYELCRTHEVRCIASGADSG